MPLTKELKIQSFVLLSKKPAEFLPSNFNQYWLDVNKIIPALTLEKSSIFTPVLVNAISSTLVLIVTPDQIQISPKNPEKFKAIVNESIVPLVKNLENIALSGVGLNYVWFLSDEGVTHDELSRRYFFNEKNPAAAFFPKDRSSFGEYLSTQISDDIKLNLEIKPTHLIDIASGNSKPCIQCAFNFHSDLKVDKQKEKVLEILNGFDTWLDTTSKVINNFK